MALATDNNLSLADASLPETKLIEMVKHVIDIGVLEELRLSERSIYNVPFNLRKVREEAYTPQCISIGPIHFGNEKLKPMQEHKLRYFHFFFERNLNEQAKMDYKHYLETKEKEIRQCYSETFPKLSKEEFMGMMLLDAVFIMELLLRNLEFKSHRFKHDQQLPETKSFREKNSEDLIMTQSWLSRNITRDLILIENQIPFFVLQKLFDDVVPYQIKNEKCFVDLAKVYFTFYDTQMFSSLENETKKHCFCGSFQSPKESSRPDTTEPKHFTDLIRCFYLPTFYLPTEGENGYAHQVLRTATKLHNSGVSFEKSNVHKPLLEVTFEKTPFLSSFLCFGCLPYLNQFKPCLRIPQLKVDHNTECIFRNLIAFEQCHYPEKPYICNYVFLIDSLIHTQLDVELLVEKEVIVHKLGSHKEVASLVNGLCKHVVINKNCYNETINKLNDHYMNDWNHNVAALRLVYFRDLWRASGTVVGIAVLVFSVFQFIRAWRYLF